MSRHLRVLVAIVPGLCFAPAQRARAAPDTVEVCGQNVQIDARSVACNRYTASAMQRLSALYRLEQLTLIGVDLGSVPSDVANRIRTLVIRVPNRIRRWKVPHLANLESIQIRTNQASLDLGELSNIGPLRQVRIEGAVVHELERLVHVRHLELSHTLVANPGAVNQLTHLETLRLTGVRRLDAITGLSKLRHLHVASCDPEIVDHVGKLHQLRTLRIGGVEAVPSLRELVHLQSLDLHGNEQLRAVPGLARLRNLVDLNLRNTGFDQTAALAKLQALEKLDLAGTPVRDISAIAGLHRLTDLNLDSTDVSSLRPLRRLRRLRTLRITTNKPTRLDLRHLAGLTELEKLELGRINPPSWRPLSRLTSLRQLQITSSNFTDTRMLQRMTGLVTLSLSSNKQLSRVRGLERMVELHTIDLDDTSVGDLSLLAKLPSLREVRADTAPLRKRHGSCASFELGKAWVTVEECGGC